MRATSQFACLTLLASVSVASSQSDLQRARLSRVMYAAFQCGTYAEMSGDQNEQQRLFNVGMKAGRDFVEAVKGGQISDEASQKEVPVVVIGLLAGPSTDFVMGRIFEVAMRDAYDEIVKGAFKFEPSKWENHKTLIQSKAETQYRASNCVLIK